MEGVPPRDESAQNLQECSNGDQNPRNKHHITVSPVFEPLCGHHVLLLCMFGKRLMSVSVIGSRTKRIRSPSETYVLTSGKGDEMRNDAKPPARKIFGRSEKSLCRPRPSLQEVGETRWQIQ